MTSSSDIRHVPRYLEEPNLKYVFPGSIKHYDSEPQSDSSSTLSSSEDSVSAPSINVQRRGVKSFHSFREAFKQQCGDEKIPSRDTIYPPYPTARLNNSIGLTPSNTKELCTNCLGMSAENLAQPGGHKHSMLSEFFESTKWCKLCNLMEHRLRLMREMGCCTRDRYQIVVSLRDTEDEVLDRPDSTTLRRSRSPTGHGHSRAYFDNSFSQLWLEAMDIRPWEAPESYKEKAYYAMSKIPRALLAPDGSKPRSVRGKPLTCLTEEHDPATEFGVEYVRHIGSDTSSPRSLEIAAGWLASCLSAESPPKSKFWMPPDLSRRHPETYPGHEAGGSQAIVPDDSEAVSFPAQYPLRLVEIQPDTRGSGTAIRVIHTGDHRYPYAALSYCWGEAKSGESRPWQTKHATLASHLRGIDRQYLPQTLQDAIYLCERLHISYLWVDCLCIIQDSPSDWEAEAAKMSGIYLGSLLTVSLSSCVSAETGCFNHKSQRIVESEDFHRKWITVDTKSKDGRSTRLYITPETEPPKLFDDEVRHGVLSQRAWVLQEHIMPQRTLYITSKQLFWECRHCRLSEDNFPQQQADWLYPICNYGFPLDATAVIEMWYKRVVEDYTRRQLTYEKDRLVAISALARATYLNRHIDYVAGLWRDCIVPGLLWRRSGPGYKSKTYSCPTWSWASQSSAVTYENATPSVYTTQPSEYFPRVQNVSWDTKPENPFGDVLFAHVDLDTKIALGAMPRDNSSYDAWYPSWQPENERQMLIITEPGPNRTICADATMDDEDGGGQNVVVAIMGHCFLLLEPPSLSSREYRRVGVAACHEYKAASTRGKRLVDMDEISLGWTRRTIRLV